MNGFEGMSAADLIRELREIGASIVDRSGQPMAFVGCPVCGEGGWAVDILTHASTANSGRNLSAPCSGPCRIQMEDAARPEGDRA